jgi:ATP-binding cassette subfamily B (MDR/TAP) protein 1
VAGDLRLDGVSFTYPTRPGVKVLEGFDMTFPRGQSVALVGASGSGKSTVVGLVERLYDPLEGRVMLDGRDVRELNVKWLRRQIGELTTFPAQSPI